MNYIQVPISVEARQMKEDGSNAKDLAEWIDRRDGWSGLYFEGGKGEGRARTEPIIIVFDPFEVQNTVSPGGWVVDIDGVFKVYDNYYFEKRFVKASGEIMNFSIVSNSNV